MAAGTETERAVSTITGFLGLTGVLSSFGTALAVLVLDVGIGVSNGGGGGWTRSITGGSGGFAFALGGLIHVAFRYCESMGAGP